MSRSLALNVVVALPLLLLSAGCGGSTEQFAFFPGAPVNTPPGPPANQPPIVRFTDGVLPFNQGAAAQPLFASVSITDDQPNLAGGLLTVRLDGVNTDVVLDATSANNIGTVSSSGNAAINVTLSGNASPANIASFLTGVQISSPAGRGLGGGRATVALSDGQGGNNFASQPGTNYVVAASNARIFRVPTAGSLPTIQSAVNAANLDGVPGAVILIAPGTYAEAVVIGNSVGLQGLQLLGPNAGISAGAQALGTVPPARGSEATVNSFQVLPQKVNLDGLTIVGDGGDALRLGSGATGLTVQNSILANSGPTTANGLLLQLAVAPASVTFANNVVRGWNEGFHIGVSDNQTFSGLRVLNNVFQNNASGLAIFRATRPQVAGNSFVDNNLIPGSPSHCILKSTVSAQIQAGDISGNDFLGAGIFALTTATSLIAEGNYWGPGGPVAGLNVEPNLTLVDVDPFSSLPFTNYPR